MADQISRTDGPRALAGRRQAENARRVILQVAGGTSAQVLLIAALLAISLNMWASAGYDLIARLPPLTVGPLRLEWPLVLGLAAFPTLCWYLWRRARRVAAAQRLRFREPHESSARAVVLFLSPSFSPARVDLPLLLSTTTPGWLGEWPAREKLAASPWRMTVEGLARHLPTLTHVAVLSSRTVTYKKPDGTEKEVLGTRRELSLLIDLLRQAKPEVNVVDVSSLAAIDGWAADGFDFEDADELARGVQLAYEHLTSACGVREKDIVIDITGGPKVSSAVGAGLAFEEDRRFQYVGQHDMIVRLYDPGYV